MNKLSESVFGYKSAVFEKLPEYGFAKEGGAYVYRTQICENQMRLTVRINSQGEVETEVFDIETDEPYTLFLVDGAAGEFVGKVRAEFLRVLENIAEKCFERRVFKNSCTQAVLDYAKSKYQGEAEYLWDNSPEGAILRRKDSNKWYALFMTVPLKRLGIASEERAEIIDLRMSPEKLERTVDGVTYFRGYHMNKKHWITFVLDGSVPLEKIYSLLDDSYILAAK